MNKLKSLCLILLIVFCNISTAQALTSITPGLTLGQELCSRQNGVVFLYFNGVNTTKPEARVVREHFQERYGDLTPEGRDIAYELMYNQTDRGIVIGGLPLLDIFETIQQRFSQQEKELENRVEYHWNIVRGRTSSTSLIGRIAESLESVKRIILDTNNLRTNSMVSTLTNIYQNPKTLQDYKEHQIFLENLITERKAILMVGHSQGNLFLNNAYDYILPKTTTASLKSFHIAPASPTVRNNHSLYGDDLVILPLALIGPIVNITDAKVNRIIPPGVNGKTDPLGHGILEIYLNDSLPMSKKIDNEITQIIADLVIPPSNSLNTGLYGFFTVSLIWDGEGDVDLHTFEPDGTHVFYANKTGNTGNLDFDNEEGFGKPEHYAASCDLAKLQVGTYSFGINNFDSVAARTATFQLTSNQLGILSTKQVTVGPPRLEAGNNSPSIEMRVIISEGPEPPITEPPTPRTYFIDFDL